MRFVLILIFCLGGYLTCLFLVNSAGWRLPCRSGPPVDGPKDPWPRVLSLPGRFVGDPASLSRDNILCTYILCMCNKCPHPITENSIICLRDQTGPFQKHDNPTMVHCNMTPGGYQAVHEVL